MAATRCGQRLRPEADRPALVANPRTGTGPPHHASGLEGRHNNPGSVEMRRIVGAVMMLASALVPGSIAEAAEVPKATLKAVADLGLQASVLDGLDAELNVPQAWIEGAKQEKEVIVTGTWEAREFREMTAAFRERYPFINLRYERAGTSGRGMQVLVALGEGRVTADVMTAIADAIFYFID